MLNFEKKLLLKQNFVTILMNSSLNLLGLSVNVALALWRRKENTIQYIYTVIKIDIECI